MHLAIWNNLLTDFYLELDPEIMKKLPLDLPVKKRVIGGVYFIELDNKLSIDDELMLAAAVNFRDPAPETYPFEDDSLLIRNTMAFSYVEDINKLKIATFSMDSDTNGKCYSLVFFNDQLTAEQVFTKSLPSVSLGSVRFNSPEGFNFKIPEFGLHSVLTNVV